MLIQKTVRSLPLPIQSRHPKRQPQRHLGIINIIKAMYPFSTDSIPASRHLIHNHISYSKTRAFRCSLALITKRIKGKNVSMDRVVKINGSI